MMNGRRVRLDDCVEVLGDVTLSLNDGWLARRLRRSPDLYQQYKAAGVSLRQFKKTQTGKTLLKEQLQYLQRLATSIGVNFGDPSSSLPRTGTTHGEHKGGSATIHEGAELLAELLGCIGLVLMQLHGPSASLPFTSSAVVADPTNAELGNIHKHTVRLAALEEQRDALMRQQTTTGPRCPSYEPVAVEEAASLSISRFQHEYAMRRRPVVIRGLQQDVLQGPWTEQWLRELVGERKVTLRRQNRESHEWARLESAERVTIAEFLQHRHSIYKSHYVFDQSIPLHLPELKPYFHMPKYFEHQFLTRLEPGSKYRDAWPSLFLGNKGVISDLHVDAFASNFWMFLISGTKRWIFFPPEDTCKLNPDLTECGQLSFRVHPFDHQPGDPTPCPLYASAQPRVCDLQAGDLLFVPSGSPHAVKNLTDTIAVSGNFVDDSNVKAVLESLSIDGLTDPGAADVRKQLCGMLERRGGHGSHTGRQKAGEGGADMGEVQEGRREDEQGSHVAQEGSEHDENRNVESKGGRKEAHDGNTQSFVHKRPKMC